MGPTLFKLRSPSAITAAADPTVPRNSRRSSVSGFFLIGFGPRVSGIGQRTSATGCSVNHTNSERRLLARSDPSIRQSHLRSELTLSCEDHCDIVLVGGSNDISVAH